MKFSVKRWKEVARAEGYTKTEAVDIISSIKKIIGWAKKNDVVIEFVSTYKQDEYSYKDSLITCSYRYPLWKQVIVLLHECGHMMLDERTPPIEYKEKYGNGYMRSTHKELNEKFIHKCDVVAEEIEAWNFGWILTKELNINLSRSLFDKVKATFLKGYFDWAVE